MDPVNSAVSSSSEVEFAPEEEEEARRRTQPLRRCKLLKLREGYVESESEEDVAKGEATFNTSLPSLFFDLYHTNHFLKR